MNERLTKRVFHRGNPTDYLSVVIPAAAVQVIPTVIGGDAARLGRNRGELSQDWEDPVTKAVAAAKPC